MKDRPPHKIWIVTKTKIRPQKHEQENEVVHTRRPMKIPNSSPVMVTGSTGYIGGVLVRQLLQAGLTVHCPVRDATNESKIEHLKELPGGQNLKFFQADLMEEGACNESMDGCSVVFHVASPFSLDVPLEQVQEKLIDPAIKGSVNILESASLVSSVRRVVVTSSILAIASDGMDCEEVREKTGKMINERTWNESASIDYQPYAYSKTLAETACWEYVLDHDCDYELVVCNPAFVMGPGVKCHSNSDSFKFLHKFGSGYFAKGIPDFKLPFVDVRDVARGHIAAGFLPSEIVANQRYILNGTNSDALTVGTFLSEAFPKYAHVVPSGYISKWLFWCVAPFIGKTRTHVWRAVGTKYEVDNSKSLRDLELGAYRPLRETMIEMFQQCLDSGYIPPPPSRGE